MKLTAIHFLGVAMLIVCTFAAPLSEEMQERGKRNNMQTSPGCPPGFVSIDGIFAKCFALYEGEEGVNFSAAVDICHQLNSQIFEPRTIQEGDAVMQYVQEKRGSTDDDVWVNFRDMTVNASFVGISVNASHNLGRPQSEYMGSLSTLKKMDANLWHPWYDEGKWREDGQHCAVWSWESVTSGHGVCDVHCDSPSNSIQWNSLVCETDEMQAQGANKMHNAQERGQANLMHNAQERGQANLMHNAQERGQANLMHNAQERGQANLMHNAQERR